MSYQIRPAIVDTIAISAPPCDACDQARKCRAEKLACCAFSAYSPMQAVGPGYRARVATRWQHRNPSRAWMAFVDGEATITRGKGRPPCPQCMGVDA